MYKSGSTSLVKDLNKKHILNLVRMNAGITARELSDKTGLQMATVLYTLKSFSESGLIREAGLGNSTIQGGKPPQTWQLNPQYGYVIGMELLSSETRAILMNFSGEVLSEYKTESQGRAEAEKYVRHVSGLTERIRNEHKISKKKLLGVGIGIPGSIDHQNGLIEYSYTFDFKEVEFRNLLQNTDGTQYEIDNDANAGALGIKWFDKNEMNTSHILYVSINQNFSGMGAGFVIDHKIYRGAHSAAGEIAVFLKESDWKNLLTRADKKFGSNFHTDFGRTPKISEVVNLAKVGNDTSKFILNDVAKQIAKKLVPLIDLLDPHSVVIGGDICEAREFIEKAIEERVAKGIISICARKTKIKYSPFGAYSVSMGAAALIFQKIF